MIKWYGTLEEFERLQEAAHINCACKIDPETDNVLEQCASHAMVDGNQKVLDHLLFMYRNRERLMEEEFRGESTTD